MWAKRHRTAPEGHNSGESEEKETTYRKSERCQPKDRSPAIYKRPVATCPTRARFLFTHVRQRCSSSSIHPFCAAGILSSASSHPHPPSSSAHQLPSPSGIHPRLPFSTHENASWLRHKKVAAGQRLVPYRLHPCGWPHGLGGRNDEVCETQIRQEGNDGGKGIR